MRKFHAGDPVWVKQHEVYQRESPSSPWERVIVPRATGVVVRIMRDLESQGMKLYLVRAADHTYRAHDESLLEPRD